MKLKSAAMKIIPLFLWVGLSMAMSSCRPKPTPSQPKPAGKVVEIPARDFYRTALNLPEKIVTADVLAKWLQEGSVVLIDLRSKEEFARSHLRGAVNLPATDITDEGLKRLVPSPDTRIVIYCESNFIGIRRIMLTTMCGPAIYQLGYHNLYQLEELWHASACKGDLNNAKSHYFCESLLPMETK